MAGAAISPTGQTARGHTDPARRLAFFAPTYLDDIRPVLFVNNEERIRTRLGDDRLDVALDPPQPSPFDGAQQIDKLAVSVRWLPSGEGTGAGSAGARR